MRRFWQDSRRVRLATAWVLSLVLIAIYLDLPDGEDAELIEAAPAEVPAAVDQKLDILEIRPGSPVPGSAVIITHTGVSPDASLQVFAGKEPLQVLARRPASVVAQLPSAVDPGRVKVRIASADQRSKPYDIRIKPMNWRKPFRNLVGGVALLLFGIRTLSRGVLEATGLASAHKLAQMARRRIVAFGLGTVVGAFMQSTTAAAALLGGLVTSSVLAIVPAAAAFSGAVLGTVAVPVLFTDYVEPREGLIAIALGVLWFGLASNRRTTALARLVLGTGLLAFGLQICRPGFEALIASPTILPTIDGLNADTLGGRLVCSLLGVALVAALQGPAPVILLVLMVAQTTGHGDLRTALTILSGAGLGAAVGALLTSPAGPRCRQFVRLNLLLGLASSLVALATVDVWIRVADALVAGHPYEVWWSKRALLPNMGSHLTVAFAVSQLATAVVLLPALPLLVRSLERLKARRAVDQTVSSPDLLQAVRTGLVEAMREERAALIQIGELATSGLRLAGQEAEHHLRAAHDVLESLLSGPVVALPRTAEGGRLGSACFACLQMHRSFEGMLKQAETLTDSLVTASMEEVQVDPLPAADQVALGEIQGLLRDGVETLLASLESGTAVDLEGARAREILTNGIEARTRRALLMSDREPAKMKGQLRVLELIDAYETAGNQVYRVAEILGESRVHEPLVSIAPPRLESPLPHRSTS